MQQRIEDIVDGTMQKMRAYGLSESTIHQYYRGFCKGIIHYCHHHAHGNYARNLLDDLAKNAEKRLEDGLIKQHHYRSLIRTIHYLNSYAETGEVDFQKLTHSRKYIPIKKHLGLIEQILERTELNQGFKYRLHSCMRHFFCFIETHDIEIAQLTDEAVREFIHEAAETNRGSMEYIAYSVNLICRYLNDNRLANLSRDFHYLVPKANPVRLIAPYTQDEISRMIQAIDPDAITAKRDKALLLTAFNTGLRGIDIVRLKLTDIDWKKGEIHIVQSKTQNPLTLPINCTVMNAIADYILEERPDCNYNEVFIRAISPRVPLKGTSALDGIVENLCQRAEVSKMPYRSFHSIRRAFATELSIAEVPLTSVSQMLGHLSIDSDRPYLSFNRRQTSLCATGFCEIPLNHGIYAGLKQGELDNGSKEQRKSTKCPSLSRLMPMGFSAVPLRGGVFS